MYVKFLDIARAAGGDIQPYALLEVRDTAGLGRRTVVPCVFITNSVFQDIPEARLDWLAEKTLESVQAIGKTLPASPRGLQIDCDWTGGTRDAYFSYLKKLKKRLPAGDELSVTIRLHQYKFPDKTGVPPADRGALMLYNTGNIDDPLEGNSIFSVADAETYLHGAPRRYPLPLELALPAFGWTLVYRDGAFWKILPELSAAELADTAFFQPLRAKAQGAALFQVRQGTFRQGHYLRPGDLLRCEAVDTTLLLDAARLARRTRPAGEAPRVIIYHLDTATHRTYPLPYLRRLCDTLGASTP